MIEYSYFYRFEKIYNIPGFPEMKIFEMHISEISYFYDN